MMPGLREEKRRRERKQKFACLCALIIFHFLRSSQVSEMVSLLPFSCSFLIDVLKYLRMAIDMCSVLD